MKKILVAVLTAVVIVAVPTIAQAATNYPKASPTFAMKDKLVFDVAGRFADWDLVPTVNNYDNRIARLNMFVGECERHPNAGCVRVDQVNRPGARWWGLWTYHGSFEGTIKLNIASPSSRKVTAHEVGHALGLEHHRYGPGAVKTGGVSAKFASRGEMKAVRSSYANYCSGTVMC